MIKCFNLMNIILRDKFLNPPRQINLNSSDDDPPAHLSTVVLTDPFTYNNIDPPTRPCTYSGVDPPTCSYTSVVLHNKNKAIRSGK